MGRFETQLVGAVRKPWRTRRSLRSLDRPGCAKPSARSHRPRYGLQRQPDAWRSREQRLERTFRLHMLPSALRLQPVRRSRAMRASTRATSIAPTAGKRCSSRSLRATEQSATSIAFRGDAAFAQPGMYEYLESRGHRVRDPPSRQSDSPGGDRTSAQAAGRAASALRAALLQELPLSGGELVPSAPSRRQSRVASRGIVPSRRLHRHEPAS